MTRPLSKHRQEIEALERELSQQKHWRKIAEEKLQKEVDHAKRWQEVAEQNATDCDRWRRKFEDARDLWNKWIEADKGGNPDSKEAYVTFEPETFKQLLSLLRP